MAPVSRSPMEAVMGMATILRSCPSARTHARVGVFISSFLCISSSKVLCSDQTTTDQPSTTSQTTDQPSTTRQTGQNRIHAIMNEIQLALLCGEGPSPAPILSRLRRA